MGRFNRNNIGKSTKPVEVLIDRLAVVEFAEAIGETGALHTNVDAARRAGYADVVAPPTYALAVEQTATHEARRRGQTDPLSLAGADFRRLLHGSERYVYHAPIVAGEPVELTATLTGVSDAKGGKLEIAHIDMTIRHRDRGDLVTITRDLIHRLG
jgi:hypothetical protein